MKKIISLVLVATMLICAVAAFTSCNKKVELVAIDAADLISEDFGIAVKKGNTELLEMINEVVDEWVNNGNMEKYVDYYEAVFNNEEANADGLKVEWDFGNATETLTVYTESGFAPFEFISNEKVIGVDIAIMNEVAVRNNMKVEVKDVAFDTITSCVKSATGHAVGAAGLTINDERKEEVDFSNIYFSSTLVIVSAKDKSYSKVADLSGLKVGVQEGTSGDLIISDAKKDGGYVVDEEKGTVVKVDSATEVKQYKSYSLVIADLEAGRIDAILMDKLPALAMIKAKQAAK